MSKKLTSLSELQNLLLEGEKQELKMDEKKREQQLLKAKQVAESLSNYQESKPSVVK